MYFYFVSGKMNSQYIPKFIKHNKNSFSLVDTFITQTFNRIPEYEFTIDKVTLYDEWYEYYVLSFHLRQFKYTNGYHLLPNICPEYRDTLLIIGD